MRAGFVQHASSVRPPKPLVVRGGLARTFGGLAGFIAVTFLCAGFYALQDAFANPLNEGASAVICAAFMITLAAVLLFFLIKPMKGPQTTSPERRVGAADPDVRPFFDQAPKLMRQGHLRNNLAYQRFYVDHSLIRP
jgi:hypothetical protein